MKSFCCSEAPNILTLLSGDIKKSTVYSVAPVWVHFRAFNAPRRSAAGAGVVVLAARDARDALKLIFGRRIDRKADGRSRK